MNSIKTLVTLTPFLAVLTLLSCAPKSEKATGAETAAAAEESSPFSSSPFSSLSVEDKYHRLDILYDVLAKDDPGNEDTQGFRLLESEGRRALAKGDEAKAGQLADEAMQLILKSRTKCYEEHKSRIDTSYSGETCAGILSLAESLKDKNLEMEKKGDDWAAGEYHQAAVEQGYLAMLAAFQPPQDPEEITDAALGVESLFKELGEGSKADQVRAEVTEHFRKRLAELSRALNDRLGGRSLESEKRIISASEGIYMMIKHELEDLSDEYDEVGKAARRYDPEKFNPPSYSARIMTWARGWDEYWAQKPYLAKQGKLPDLYQKDVDVIMDNRNKIKEGAAPTTNTGINITEIKRKLDDQFMYLEVKIENAGYAPIMRPKMVVTGTVISEVKDLGIKKFMPGSIEKFPIVAVHFIGTIEPDAYTEHELVLLYDLPDGTEKKIIQPVVKEYEIPSYYYYWDPYDFWDYYYDYYYGGSNSRWTTRGKGRGFPR